METNKDFCKNCRYPLDKNWHYCPNCGMEVEKWHDKLSFGLDDIINQVMKDLQNLLIKGIFKIDVKPLPDNFTPAQNISSRVEVNENKRHNAITHNFLRNVKEVIEPEANVVKGEDFTEVEMEVKEVKSLDDVYIVLYDNSAEIRAYTHDNKKMYFKVVEIPPYAEITDKILKENGKLIIRFEIIDDDYEE